jgi:lycopene beta-cyclase
LSSNRPALRSSRRLRTYVSLAMFSAWTVSTILLISGWRPGTYLTLILSWALLPVLIQTAFGADLLWARRRELLLSVLTPTVYLWLVDAIAIRSGTWTIDPAQTTGAAIAGLPIEEMLFFFMTNLIIVFGITLMLADESGPRMKEWVTRLRGWVSMVTRSRAQNSQVAIDTSVPDDARQPQMGWRITSAIWILLLLATPISLWFFGPRIFLLLITLLVLAQTAAVLAALSQTWRVSAIFSSMTLIILFAWGAEWFGSSTGVPFGGYEYTQSVQPQIGGVPLIIPLAWAMMLIPAWGVVQVILRPHQSRLRGIYPFLYAALSGLAFTAWDLYLDPQMVERGLWSWQAPGQYYGIPWLNYLGWWLVSAMITLIIRPKNLPSAPLLLIYTITWLFQAIGAGVFVDQPGPALTGFFGMGIFALLAWRQQFIPWNSVFDYLPFQRSVRMPNPEKPPHSIQVHNPPDNRLPAGDNTGQQR